MNHRIVFVVSLLSLAGPAAGQEPGRGQLAEWYQQYRSQFILVEAGAGLKAVTLGAPVVAAQRAWGTPRTQRRGPPWARKTSRFFRADRYTEIRVDGRRVVERLVFRGRPGSLYETARGARFGMRAVEVAILYGPGKIEGREALAYPRRGIRFFFTGAVLTGFEVFPRAAASVR